MDSPANREQKGLGCFIARHCSAWLVLALCVSGCADENRQLNQIRRARHSLKEEMTDREDDPDEVIQEYLLPGCERADDWLEAGKAMDFQQPKTFFAAFDHSIKDDEEQVYLSVRWLETEFHSIGVYLETNEGDVLGEYQPIEWTASERETYRSIALRQLTIGIALDGHKPDGEITPREYAIDLPKSVFEHPIKAGVVTARGRARGTVLAYIPESLKKPARKSASDPNDATGSVP